jgi:hypothetical protein
LISSIIFILDKILVRRGLGSFQEIKYRDFYEEICFYSNPSSLHLEKDQSEQNNKKDQKTKFGFKDELDKDLKISIFKLKIGERLVSAFEDANLIINQ